MKKLFKYVSITILSILALVVMILAILSIKFSPRYVYRLARYHMVDVYDYTHFENRVIEASERAFPFSRNPDEPYVESLFKAKVLASGFSSFNEWAEKSQTTAIDYARFGSLFLKGGNWNGRQIISKEWIRESTLEDTTISRDFYPHWMGEGCQRTYYKYQWWGHTNCDSSYQFFASGNLGQEIYILPDKEIIIVHCGNSLEHYNADVLRGVADAI